MRVPPAIAASGSATVESRARSPSACGLGGHAGEIELLVDGAGGLRPRSSPSVPWPSMSGCCTTPGATTRRSRARTLVRRAGPRAVDGGAQRVAPGPVVRSMLTVPGARAAISSRRAITFASSGARGSATASASSSDAKSRRASGDSRLSHELAQCRTVWWRARVKATYARRSASPCTSATCCSNRATWPDPVRPPTSIDRRPPAAASWNSGSWLGRDPRRLPEERAVDDRELEALAPVDRQHLHRGGVRLEPAAAVLVVHVVGGLADAGPQPGGEGADAESLGRHLVVEQLPDVEQIGQVALAVLARQDPGGKVLVACHRLEQRCDSSGAQHRRPVVEADVDALPRRVVGGRDPLDRPSDERGQGGGVDP